VDGTFAIEVEADREATILTFDGVEQASSFARSLGTEELVAGYAEEFDVATASGGLYVVNLSSECE
jgi:hypothetical protein